MQAPVPYEKDPWAALQPKSETAADQFILDTGVDGTGVVVAILDTGVDPGAAGLSVCPDGRPKIIDILDCTGSGDVDTSTKVDLRGTVSAASLDGLSGRTLKLNPAWVNPSGEWRLGIKRAFELYPRGLAGRVKEKRKKPFDTVRHATETALQRAVAEAKAQAPAAAAPTLQPFPAPKGGAAEGGGGAAAAPEASKIKGPDLVKDLETRLEQLTATCDAREVS